MTPHKILLFALCLLFVSAHADLCNFSPVCFNIATHYKLGRNFATGLPQLQLFKQIQSVPDPSYGLVYNVDFYPNNTKLPPAYCNGVTTCSEAIRYESKYIEVLEAYMAILDDSTQALTYVNVFPATGVVSHTLVQQLPFESDLAFKSPKVGASIESSSKIAVEATCPTGCMKDVSGYQMGLNEDHFFIIFYNQAGKQVLNANFGETAQNSFCSNSTCTSTVYRTEYLPVSAARTVVDVIRRTATDGLEIDIGSGMLTQNSPQAIRRRNF